MANETTTDALKDLIEINNDRVAGFEKAAKDLQPADQDLKSIFSQFASQSRSNVSELQTLAGADADKGNSVLGAVHRAWIDVKATFSGHDRKSVLQECERGEDAIKKAYKSALEESANLSNEARTVIGRQQQGINAGHDQIKALRDAQV